MRDALLSILLEHLEPFEALKWLEKPHHLFDGKSPAQIIVERGYDEVLTVAVSGVQTDGQQTDREINEG